MRISLRSLALVLLILLFLMVGIMGFSPTRAQQPVTISVWDNAQVLDTAAQQELQQQVSDLTLKPEITHIDYLTFSTNDESFNDTVLNHLKQQHPELLSPDQTQYADGHLIIAVGFSPRKLGVYCGDDVCATTGLRGTGRIQQVSDTMVDDLRAGNYVSALVSGTETAGDAAWQPPKAAANDSFLMSSMYFTLLFSFVIIFFIIVVTIIIISKLPKAPTLDELWEVALPNALPAVDPTDQQVRALNSQLATRELRSEWEELKQKYLGLISSGGLQALQSLGPNPTKKQLKANRELIRTALQLKEDVQMAQENIDVLYKLEQGDIDTRKEQLDKLSEDISRISGIGSTILYGNKINELDNRVYELSTQLDSPTFISSYADIISSYGEVLRKIKRWRSVGSSSPSLTSKYWRTGMGINGFMSYAELTSLARANSSSSSSSSSGVSTSYSSSSSFSGGGGSTNW